MRKRSSKSNPLIKRIEYALRLGEFVAYSESWDFARELDETKSKVDVLANGGEAERAIGLCEIFLSGCHEKAEEVDDSDGALGNLFQELLLSWIKARQIAGCEATETVRQILKWRENDEYGFCYDIEGDVV